MKEPVMVSTVPEKKIMSFVQNLYRVSFNPEFFLRKIFSIRDTDDLRYFSLAFKKVLGHVFDFRK